MAVTINLSCLPSTLTIHFVSPVSFPELRFVSLLFNSVVACLTLLLQPPFLPLPRADWQSGRLAGPCSSHCRCVPCRKRCGYLGIRSHRGSWTYCNAHHLGTFKYTVKSKNIFYVATTNQALRHTSTSVLGTCEGVEGNLRTGTESSECTLGHVGNYRQDCLTEGNDER